MSLKKVIKKPLSAKGSKTRGSSESMQANKSRRRSSASISGPRFCLEFVPEYIPDNEKAWETYLEEPSCRSLHEEFRRNEYDLDSAYSKYVQQLSTLQDIMDEIEDRKCDLEEAKMFRTFNVITKSEDDSNIDILGDAEELCTKKLENTRAMMKTQQEEILRLQAILKIHLNLNKVLKKQLNQDFAKYCFEKYQIELPNLEFLSEEKVVEPDSSLIEPKCKSESKASLAKISANFKELKNEMIRSRNQYLQFKENDTKWKNNGR